MDERAFLKLILARPDDDDPRLVFADWLGERGDPRGEFIRVQCRLASMDERDSGRIELEFIERQRFAEHGRAWSEPLRERVGAGEVHFRRGLVNQVAMSASLFDAHWKTLAESCPLESVRILNGRDGWETLLASDGLPRLRGLDLSDGQLGLRRLRRLIEGVDLSKLTTLCLGSNNLGSGAMPMITRSPRLSGLESLHLDTLPLDPDGLALLATSEMSRTLSGLSLASASMRDEMLEVLARSDILPRLLRLDLSRNDMLSSDSMQRFVGSPRFAKLREVSFRSCNLWASDISFLARIRQPMALRKLTLERSKWSGSAAKSFGKSVCSKGLAELSLRGCDLDDAMLETILRGDGFDVLRSLDLSRNSLGPAAAEAICGWSRASGISTLNLRDNQIGDQGVATLAEAESLRKLNELDLRGNEIGDRGARALIESSTLQRLTTLRLDFQPNASEPRFRPEFVEALRSRFGRHVCLFDGASSVG
ncbi:MAG: TIGR02996 domain-containing protein [Rubripirellula sp.]